MGWDAYATGPRGGELKVIFPRGEGKYPYLADRKLRRVFEEAAKRVVKKAGSVDGLLDHGGLDCSNCAEVIREATGESVNVEDGWSPAYVKAVHESAFWEKFTARDEEYLGKWAIESSREFLRVCAENNLGVRFSW